MSTHAMIARKTTDGFTGRYHHSDGYPSGLGKALWYLLALATQDDELERIVKTLVDEHPAGWSNILGVDWSRTPGFGPGDQPQCYCHGQRNEPADLYREDEKAEFDYSYVINPGEQAMAIWVGGVLLAPVDLTGPEPDWTALDIKARGVRA